MDASRGRIPAMILLFGVLALMGFTIKGACGEWSALLLHTEKGQARAWQALALPPSSPSSSVVVATGVIAAPSVRQPSSPSWAMRDSWLCRHPYGLAESIGLSTALFP